MLFSMLNSGDQRSLAGKWIFGPVRVQIRQAVGFQNLIKKRRRYNIILTLSLDSSTNQVLLETSVKVLPSVLVSISLKWSISRQDELDWGVASVPGSTVWENKIHHVHAASFLITKTPCPCLLTFRDRLLEFQEHWINA